MLNNISKRATEFPDNPIRGLEPLASQARANGVNVIPLNIGAPDTNSPKESIKSAIKFLEETPALKYGASAGNPDLIQQLVHFYTDRCDFKDIEIANLMVTQGASEALELVFYSIADQGATLATPDPMYTNYFTIAKKNSLTLEPIATNLEGGFHLTQASLEKLSDKVQGIIWSSPNNPTGAVYQPEELKMLLEFARKRNIWLIADEVYRSLVFDQNEVGFHRAPSILDFATKEDRKRIIVLDSMSKLLGLCGARIGTITAPAELISLMIKIASTRGCPSTISQATITPINDIPDSFFADNRAVFQKRRDLLYAELAKLADLGVIVPPQPPEGAFYLVIEITNVNGADFAKWLLTDYPKLSRSKETVFVTPMLTSTGGFYLDRSKGASQLRLAYVINEDLLVKAVSILKKALQIYQ